MPIYRVVDWEQHFENNRTRELKSMTWVPVPNKHDGDGFTQLMEHENGAAHLGVWLVVVQIASKCDPRGTLLRDSRNGLRSGHDSQSISRISRIPRQTIEEAIERLLVIGWVEDISLETQDLQELSHETAARSQESAMTSHLARARGPEGKGREGNDTEGNGEPADDVGRYADAMAEKYPRFGDGGPSGHRALFELRKLLPPLADFEAALDAWASSLDWTEDGGKFVPRPEKWLRSEGWKAKPRSRPATFSEPPTPARIGFEEAELEARAVAAEVEAGPDELTHVLDVMASQKTPEAARAYALTWFAGQNPDRQEWQRSHE